jgi:uncharacterized protein (TIGR02996 family)
VDERTALKRAICEAPGDDAPRLVFADWLHDHGEGDWAELIRVQVELARLEERGQERRRLFTISYDDEPGDFPAPDVLRAFDPDAARWVELLPRSYELEADLKDRLRAEFPAPDGAEWREGRNCRRGSPHTLHVTSVPRFLRSAGEARGASPVQGLAFPNWPSKLPRSWAADLAATGLLGSLEEISSYNSAPARDVRALLHRPELAGLRSLYLAPETDPQGALEAVARAHNLVGLRSLRVSTHTAGGSADAVAAGLFGNPALRGLRRVDWSLGHAGNDKLRFLGALASAGWDQLGELSIWEGSIFDQELWRAMARGDGLPALRSLGISGGLETRSVEALLTSPTLRRLTTLWLDQADCRDLNAARLRDATSWPPLQSLELYMGELSAGGVRALVSWPGFTGLWRLAVTESPWGQGIKALADTPPSASLRTLVLRDCGLGPSDVQALAAAPLLGSLLGLDLGKGRISRQGAIALASSPHLDNLAVLSVDREGAGAGWRRLVERFGARLRDASA